MYPMSMNVADQLVADRRSRYGDAATRRRRILVGRRPAYYGSRATPLRRHARITHWGPRAVVTEPERVRTVA
jgi:hypothetical protein